MNTPLQEGIPVPRIMPPANKLNKVRVALVLGGGGARALAHLGALEVLEKNNIPIDLIVGTSAGSMIGAMYADNPHALTLKEKVIGLKKWDIIDVNWFSALAMSWRLTGVTQGYALKDFLQKNISAKEFHQLKIPLAVVTTDLYSGEPFVIRSGPLIPALHASSALPMLFSPVDLYGKTLVDGGVASPVPVDVAKQFSPQVIIAIDIGTSPNYGKINNAYRSGYRSLHISYYHLSKWQTKEADIVIHPAVDEYSMFADHANEDLYNAGKLAAQKAIPDIRRALKT